MNSTLTALLLMLIATAALQAQPYREGEVLVRLKQGNSKGLSIDVGKKFNGCTIKRNYQGLERASSRAMLHLSDSSRSTAELVEQFRKDPRVEAVSPNYRKYLSLAETPNDPDYTFQWGLHNTGQSISGVPGNSDDDIDWRESRLLSSDSPDEVVIAIIDSGVDIYHDDLIDSLWVNPNEIPNNGIDDDNNGYIDDIHGYDFGGDDYFDSNDNYVDAPPDNDPSDPEEHGTHVAGIAAATADNGLGVAGVSSAKIMALKIDDGFGLFDSYIIAAMDYVVTMKNAGVNVIVANGSYGGPGFNSVEEAAMEDLRNVGVIFCAAAGNDNENNEDTPHYPSNYETSNIIAVASTDNRDQLSDFSNFGSISVDIGAPGTSILSTIPGHIFANTSVQQGVNSYSSEPMYYTGMTDSITRPFINCGLGGPSDFPASVNGNIALIERGTYYFYEKLENAMAAGAVAAVIYNSATADSPNTPVLGDLGRPNGWIPSIGISRPDGLALAALANGVNTMAVSVTLNPIGGYDFISGTSMASPMVAGAIAVLAQHFPNDTMSQRIQRLYNAVDPIPALTGQVSTGGRLNLANALDTDGDQVPDWYELEIFAQTGGTTINTTSDTDGDGTPDIWEFRAGTDPVDPADSFAIKQVATIGGSSMDITFPSADGRIYDIYSSPSLDQPFTLYQSDVGATQPENTINLPIGAESGFYEVRLNWPD